MNKDRVALVVTTIHSPNQSLLSLSEGAIANKWQFVIVGDSKTPKDFRLKGSDFYDLSNQKTLEFKLAQLCPEKHYSRKNIGYLLAMKEGNNIIVETDDDNIPCPEFWRERSLSLLVQRVRGQGWINAYSLFGNSGVWPRGLPLENILTQNSIVVDPKVHQERCYIQQGLADGDPDVDAVYRLTRNLPITFDKHEYPFKLQSGLWSPFNSQNTTWFKEAFLLLYLPSFCSFRMTDIWRSFVAQRIAWECGWDLTIHNASVFQDRNKHDFLLDFEQEIPGYLLNSKIKILLEDVSLRNGVEYISQNLRTCYSLFINEGVIQNVKELELLGAWIEDVESLS